MLDRIGRMGHFLGHRDRFRLQGHQIGQRVLGFVVQRLRGIEFRLLFQIAEMHAVVQPKAAAVGVFPAGQNFQQSRFPATVRADQADAVAGPDLEGHAVQNRIGAEMFPYAFDFQKNHR